MSKTIEIKNVNGKFTTYPTPKWERKSPFTKKNRKEITANIPGKVISVCEKTKVGNTIKKGDVLIKLEAMKMVNSITSTIDGEIKEIKVKENDNVEKGEILVILK